MKTAIKQAHFPFYKCVFRDVAKGLSEKTRCTVKKQTFFGHRNVLQNRFFSQVFRKVNEHSNGRMPPRSLSATAAALTLFASLSSFETLYAESEKTDVEDEESGGDIEFVQYGGSAHENNLAKQKKRYNSGLQSIPKPQNATGKDSNSLWKQCSAISCYLTIGPRKYMEDEYYISNDGTFFAVYDGHGGGQVSKYLADRFYSVYKNLIDGQRAFLGLASFGKDYRDALLKTFDQVQNEIVSDNSLDHVGSTCVGVILNDSSIWSFNVGDSRAVLCRNGKAIDLTVDHKPNDPKEEDRIRKLGGFVFWDGYKDENGLPVPGHGCYRVNGNLAMSRAMGDNAESPYVNSNPDVTETQRKFTEDKFIIIASDGLWDVMSSQEAVDFVMRNMISIGPLQLGQRNRGRDSGSSSRFLNGGWSSSLEALLRDAEDKDADRESGSIRMSMQRRRNLMSQYLVEEALSRGTQDNTSVIVVWLQ